MTLPCDTQKLLGGSCTFTHLFHLLLWKDLERIVLRVRMPCTNAYLSQYGSTYCRITSTSYRLPSGTNLKCPTDTLLLLTLFRDTKTKSGGVVGSWNPDFSGSNNIAVVTSHAAKPPDAENEISVL